MISVKLGNILLHFFITAQISIYHDCSFIVSGTVQTRKTTLAPQSSLLCENYVTFFSGKGKDNKKAQYIKQLEIPAHQVSKYNQMAVLYRNHSRVRRVWRKQIWWFCVSHGQIYPGGRKHKGKNGWTRVMWRNEKAISTKEPLQINRIVKPSETELRLTVKVLTVLIVPHLLCQPQTTQNKVQNSEHQR